MSMYYSDGGPGPATKLYRVDAPDGASEAQWQQAPSFRWTAQAGWFAEPLAQLYIRQSGELFLIDDSQASDIQNEMRESWERQLNA